MIVGWLGSEGREGGGGKGRERERERGGGENVRVCVMESDVMRQSTEILFVAA